MSDFELRETTGDGVRVLRGSAIVADGNAGESGSGVEAGDAGRSGITAGVDLPVDEEDGVLEFTVSLLALAASFARILSSRVVRGRGVPSAGLLAGLAERWVIEDWEPLRVFSKEGRAWRASADRSWEDLGECCAKFSTAWIQLENMLMRPVCGANDRRKERDGGG